MKPPEHLRPLYDALVKAGVREPLLMEAAALPDLTIEDIEHTARYAQAHGKTAGWIVVALLNGERAPR